MSSDINRNMDLKIILNNRLSALLDVALSASTPQSRAGQAGFSLVEMAMVLMIFGLLLGGMLIPLSVQIDQKNYSDARKSLDEIKETLIGYALVKGHLPCPAVSHDNGLEDRTGGDCNKRVGFLPWQTLGIKPADQWGHLYRYSVTPSYAKSDHLIKISPLAGRDITIKGRNASGNLVNFSNLDDIPAVVMSHGKKASSATSQYGYAMADASISNVDEDSNAAANGRIFISRDITDNTAIDGGEFDDLIVWLSPNIYISKMVTAGRLP